MERISIVGAALLAAALASAQPGQAQDYPNYAPRCSTAELQAEAAMPDPCSPQVAHFGLSGPTPLRSGDIDVEATGSILPRDAVHDTSGRSAD